MKGVKSKDILLSVNMGTEGSPNWLLIGCSTSDGYSSSRDSVAISTKCSGDFVENLPGDFTWSFSNTSYIDKDSDGTFATLDQIFDLSKEDVNRQWKLESIDQDYVFLRIGYGFISDFSNTADQGDYLQFDLTVTGSGEPMNLQTT
jgi:predicted secreted protein